MKKFLVVFLSLSIMVCIFFSQLLSTSAASGVEVTVGMSFAWNDSSATPREWIQSKGVSPDGLWRYQYYALEKGIYQDLSAIYSNGFAWSTNPGIYGLGYARVRNNGINFHPAQTADVVKCFTCPSGGMVEVSSTITRLNEVDMGAGANGTSFFVYLEDVLVYPADGSPYVELNSTTPYDAVFLVEVKGGQRLYFHIGAIGGNSLNDSTNMTNTVVYKTVNDSSVSPAPEATPPYEGFNPGEIILETPEPDLDDSGVPVRPQPDSDEKDEDSSSQDIGKNEDDNKNEENDKGDDRDEKDGGKESSGLSSELIALIAYGSVGVLILVAVAVLIIVSKKK